MSEKRAQVVHLRHHFDPRFNMSAARQQCHFNADMAALADFKTHFKRNGQLISALSERVAILESRHQ